MLNRIKVTIKNEKDKYYTGELENGKLIKISKESLTEQLNLESKYIVSGRIRNTIFSKMLIVSNIESVKEQGRKAGLKPPGILGDIYGDL